MQFAYASPLLEKVVANHKGVTGEEARAAVERSLGIGSNFTVAEQRSRRDEALAICQREGIPQIIERCRSGDPAAMEQGASTLEFIADRDPSIACNIVQCGGLPPLVAIIAAPARANDEDDTFSMQEVAVRAIHAIAKGDASNQRPVAESGAIPL